MDVLIINIETKEYVCFQSFQTDDLFMFNELNENYVHLPIKEYNRKISMKLVSHEYFNILTI